MADIPLTSQDDSIKKRRSNSSIGNAPKRVSFSTYPQDYYSGAQCRVYFGSIYIDDIATIQYQTSQTKTPLYGYNDHQFRAVSKGQFIVRGTFTLAFKETGYLRVVMDLIKNENREIFKTITKDRSGAKIQNMIKYLNQGLTPEQALDKAARQGRSKTFGGATDISDAEDVMEVLEDSIWGRNTTPASYKKRIPRSDEMDYNKYTGKTAETSSVASDIDLNGFDILMTFGDYRAGSDIPEHTMISLNDVHITGESLIASPADEPIGMTYEFFARGINERVSELSDTDKKAIEDANIPSDLQLPKELLSLGFLEYMEVEGHRISNFDFINGNPIELGSSSVVPGNPDSSRSIPSEIEFTSDNILIGGVFAGFWDQYINQLSRGFVTGRDAKFNTKVDSGLVKEILEYAFKDAGFIKDLGNAISQSTVVFQSGEGDLKGLPENTKYLSATLRVQFTGYTDDFLVPFAAIRIDQDHYDIRLDSSRELSNTSGLGSGIESELERIRIKNTENLSRWQNTREAIIRHTTGLMGTSATNPDTFNPL